MQSPDTRLDQVGIVIRFHGCGMFCLEFSDKDRLCFRAAGKNLGHPW